MFTIKFYRDSRMRIFEAESFTVLRGDDGEAEITIHQKNGEDFRRDVGITRENPDEWPEVFDRAIIENGSGRTTEVIAPRPRIT